MKRDCEVGRANGKPIIYRMGTIAGIRPSHRANYPLKFQDWSEIATVVYNASNDYAFEFQIELDTAAMIRQWEYLRAGNKGSGPRAASVLPLNASIQKVMEALNGNTGTEDFIAPADR